MDFEFIETLLELPEFRVIGQVIIIERASESALEPLLRV